MESTPQTAVRFQNWSKKENLRLDTHPSAGRMNWQAMKFSCLFLVVCVVLAGCGASPTPTVTKVAPTFAPLVLAQTTNAPTPTRDSNPASLPSPPPIATSTLAPESATATAAPSPTAAPQNPAILTRFKLLDLPGEGRAPGPMALLADALYVANRRSANIAVVAGDRAGAYIPLDANPNALVGDPTRSRIYAATYETPTLYLIEKDRVVKQAAAGGSVNALALDADTLYVGLDSNAIIERYDAETLAKKDELKLSQGFGVSSLVLDKARNRLYAVEYGKIIALDLDSFRELNTFAAPYLYTDFAVNPADGSIWTGAYDEKSSRAYVVGYKPDGHEIARLYVGADLQAATFDDSGRLYVLDRFNNQVHVVQTPQAQLVATIPVNELPNFAIFEPKRGIVFVTSQSDDNIAVIDVAALQVINTIPLANRITALASNSKLKRVYAANGSSNSVFIIEGNRIVGQVKTGNSPVDLALDETTNRLYVASYADGMLTVIDQDTLEITATQFITRFLSTVAIDPVNKKLFAGSSLLDPETLKPEATFFAQGLTINSQTTPQFERANPALKKLYATASNGVPGSNSRQTLYRFSYDDLSRSTLLGSKNGGNTTALVIDPTTNNLFATNTHPLAYKSALDVFDASDTLVSSLALAARTTALVLNPASHHLFLAHSGTFQPDESGPAPPDNRIEILDTRTLGHVANLEVPNSPVRMTLLDDRVYVASHDDGSITIIGDALTAQPPAPTPTLTPTLFPTWTFTPPSQAAATLTSTSTPEAQSIATATLAPAASDCTIGIAEPLRAKADQVGRAALGCATGPAETTDKFAFQPFAAGAYMFDDFRSETSKQVYVLFPDKTYYIYPDTWRDVDEDLQCANVEVPGLWHPKRGFGSVWCNRAEVQALGGGLVEEHAVIVTEQHFEHGTIWSVPDVGVFVLFETGTWQ